MDMVLPDKQAGVTGKEDQSLWVVGLCLRGNCDYITTTLIHTFNGSLYLDNKEVVQWLDLTVDSYITNPNDRISLICSYLLVSSKVYQKISAMCQRPFLGSTKDRTCHTWVKRSK